MYQYCFCGVCIFSRNITLNLSGRKWQKSVQKLDDKDAFIISKCLKNRFVTGEQTNSDESPNYIFQLYELFCISFNRS